MVRLYVTEKLSKGCRVALSKEELRYWKSSRRQQGPVILFNELGEEATGNFEEDIFVVENVTASAYPIFNITVAIAWPDSSIIPALIRHVSELGAKRLIFFPGERSQSARKREMSDRWPKIAIEAARQSARAKPLQIGVSDFLSLLQESCDKKWFFDESLSSTRVQSSENIRSAIIFIGCEGGWSEAERQRAKEFDAELIHLDTPILKVDTAATCATFFAIQKMKADDAN